MQPAGMQFHKYGSGGFESVITSSRLKYPASGIAWTYSSGVINANDFVISRSLGVIDWPIRLINASLYFESTGGGASRYNVPLTVHLEATVTNINFTSLKGFCFVDPDNASYTNHQLYLEYEQL
jgi:hypothetical protein